VAVSRRHDELLRAKVGGTRVVRVAGQSRGTPARIAWALATAATVALLAALIGASPASATAILEGEWGSQGSGDGQFNLPYGITTDADGNVYVADTDNNRVQKFTSNGAFITKWGSRGAGAGQFDFPFDVATDAAGNVYVADFGNDRVQRFNASGSFLGAWGSEGSGDGQFDGPVRLAVDPASSDVYVADRYNNRIQKFTSTGAFITKWGPRQGFLGSGLATDAHGDVFVAVDLEDHEMAWHEIERYTSNGAFVTYWGSRSWGDLADVATDAGGDVYVALGQDGGIQKWTSNGAFITRWKVPEPRFARLDGIAVGPDDSVYVADSPQNRILRFRIPPGLPAKLEVSRAKIRNGRLAFRGSISPAAAGARVALRFRAAGQRILERVTVGERGEIQLDRKLRGGQRRARAGRLTVRFAGNDSLRAATERLRAARRAVKLRINRARLKANRLIIAGQVKPRARRQVRIQIEFNRPDGAAAAIGARVQVNARGRWRLRRNVPAAVRDLGAWVSVTHPGRRALFGQSLGGQIGG
jgi:DNA-binding beta-propeller fold protein YncE